MKPYQTPEFYAVRIEDEDILTVISNAGAASDALVDKMDYVNIRF